MNLKILLIIVWVIRLSRLEMERSGDWSSIIDIFQCSFKVPFVNYAKQRAITLILGLVTWSSGPFGIMP